MSDGIQIRGDVTNEVRRITLDGGRERVHPTGAAGLVVLLLVFTAVGFLAGWITGTWL